MNFLTLPYNCVTISFLPEIWFWGPTHPTFLYDVTLFSLFFIEGFPYQPLQTHTNPLQPIPTYTNPYQPYSTLSNPYQLIPTPSF